MNLKVGPWFKNRRKRRTRLQHEKAPVKSRTRVLTRVLLGAMVLAATLAIFPLTVTFSPPTYLEGSISAEEILAPFDFDISKDDEELAKLRADQVI